MSVSFSKITRANAAICERRFSGTCHDPKCIIRRNPGRVILQGFACQCYESDNAFIAEADYLFRIVAQLCENPFGVFAQPRRRI